MITYQLGPNTCEKVLDLHVSLWISWSFHPLLPFYHLHFHPWVQLQMVSAVEGTHARGPEPCRGCNHCSHRAGCPVLGWGAESLKRWNHWWTILELFCLTIEASMNWQFTQIGWVYIYSSASYLFRFVALSIIATHTLGCSPPVRLLFFRWLSLLDSQILCNDCILGGMGGFMLLKTGTSWDL